MNMLEGMADGTDKIDDLVILGDLMEFELVPMNQTTTYSTDLFSHKDIYGFNVPKMIQAVKKVASPGTKI